MFITKETKETSGIYKITNLTNNKCYVGSAKDFNKRWNRHYLDLINNKHHSIKLQRSFNKHGIDNFMCEIIEEIPYEKNLIIERENYWINEYNSKENGYNIADASFGDIISTHPNKKEIIEKISKTVKENMENLTKEERQIKFGKFGELNGMFGKNHSEETKKIISEKNLGNKNSSGRIMSKEQKLMLSDIAKERVGENNPFYGKTHSEETKKKLSEKRKGIQPTNIKPIIIDNIKYSCVREASEKLNIKEQTIRYRCLSNNEKFKDYNYE
jgi:group I intron endonuclease